MKISFEFEPQELESLATTATTIVAALVNAQTEQTKLGLASAEKIGEAVAGGIAQLVQLATTKMATEKAKAEAGATAAMARAAVLGTPKSRGVKKGDNN